MARTPTLTAGLTFWANRAARDELYYQAQRRGVSIGEVCRETMDHGRRRMRPYKALAGELAPLAQLSFMVTPEYLAYLRAFAAEHALSLSQAARAHLTVGLREKGIGA